MSNGTKVKKRDGRIEPLDLDKMHLMVEEATKGLAGVSASQVEMTSGIQFYDGITTAEIQEILIKSASDLIDLDHPKLSVCCCTTSSFAISKADVWEDEKLFLLLLIISLRRHIKIFMIQRYLCQIFKGRD